MGNDAKQEITSNVLLHLYNSVVIGSAKGIGLVIGMGSGGKGTNPRHKDLKLLYDSLGRDKRDVFYNAVAAIAEFAVYQTLDFIENYNDFRSESNANDCPRLSLDYIDESGERVTISRFSSNDLGLLFKHVARDDQVRRLVDTAISNLTRKNEKETPKNDAQ